MFHQRRDYAAAIKKFEYSPFDSELKKTGIAKDQD